MKNIVESEILSKYISYKVEKEDIILDIELLLKEHYYCSFNRQAGELELNFSNGENFIIKVEKIA